MHDAYHIHGIHAPVQARRGDYAQILTWMLNYAPVTDNEDYTRNYAGIIRRSLPPNCAATVSFPYLARRTCDKMGKITCFEASDVSYGTQYSEQKFHDL